MSIKFKSWRAINLAKGLNGIFATAGVVLEEQKDEDQAFKAWKQKGKSIEKELKLLEKK